MYRPAITKRQAEVLERIESGYSVRKIATDIGVTRGAVYQIIDRLRREGVLAEDFTPSGGVRRTRAAAGVPAAAGGSRLRELRELARRPGDGRAFGAVLAAAIAEDDVPALAYELGRLDAGGVPELVESGHLVEHALRRLSLIDADSASRSAGRERP